LVFITGVECLLRGTHWVVYNTDTFRSFKGLMKFRNTRRLLFNISYMFRPPLPSSGIPFNTTTRCSRPRIYFHFFRAKVYVYEMSQLLALFYVFFKIFIHIEYLKKHITSIKIKIIHSYMFQSPYDHHQGVFFLIFPIWSC